MYNKFMSIKIKNIVFAADENQAIFSLVNSLMILDQTNEEIFIYLIFLDISKKLRKTIDIFMNKFDKSKNINLIFINSNDINLWSSKLEHVTKATNIRIYLSTLLNEVDEVLYLDNDTVVDGDISVVFDFFEEDKFYGRAWNKENYWPKKLNKMGLNKVNNEIYINAGVIFLSLKFLRENDIEKRMIEFMEENIEKIKFADQDILNCNINFNTMPFTWNLARSNWPRDNKYIAWKSKLKIYHFLSKNKQWGEDIGSFDRKSYIDGKGSLNYRETKKLSKPQKKWKKYFERFKILINEESEV